MSEVMKVRDISPPSEQNSFQAIGRLELLLESVMGDRDLLIEMAELWIEDSRKQETQIRNGLASGDAIMIQRAAHALKGSVGTFQAPAAQDAANELELSAKNADLAGARIAFNRLLSQINLVKDDLHKLARGHNPSKAL